MNMKLKPEAILFDFGGTIDTNGVHWSEKYWDGYLYAKVPVTKAIYEKAYVYAGDRMLTGSILPTFSFKQTIAMQIEMQLKWLVNSGEIPSGKTSQYLTSILKFCYDDVVGTIKALIPFLENIHKKFKSGIVSNFYGNINNVLKEFNINEYFDLVIDSAVVGIRKPDPEIFLLGVNRFGIHPSKVLVIGDSYDRDIEPASKAGCMTAWLKGRSWTVQPGGELADITINNLQELNLILEL